MNNFTGKKNSEEEYRLIIENANDLIAVINETGEYEFINEKTHLRLTGYSKEDLIGKKALDFVDPNHREMAEKTMKKAFEIGEYSGELRMKNKMGSYGWFHVTSRVFKDQNGNRKILTIKRDITKRKKIENALRNSEERFRSLVETTSDWIWEVDQNGVYTYSSPKVLDLLGYEPEEIIGKTPFDLMSSHEADRVSKRFQSILQSQESFDGLENTNQHKDGRVIMLETSGVPIFSDNGDFKGYRGIDRDISERKKAEYKLNQSKVITDNINEALILFDMDGATSFINPAYEKLTGYKSSEIIGKNGFEIANMTVVKHELEKILDAFANALQGKVLPPISTYLKNINGREIPIEFNVSFIRDEEGKIDGIVAVITDITERKFAEQKLKESEKNYRRLYENALVGLWTSIIDGGKFIRANDTAAKIAGFENADDLINNTTAIDLFNYETRVEFIRQLKEHGTKSGFEAELIDKNGNKKQISISGKIDQEKGIIEGVFINISDLKRTQKALIESQEMLQLVMDNIPIYIFWKDIDSVYMGCNRNFAKVSGIGEPENIVGKTDYDLTPIKEQADSYREIDRRIINTNSPEYHIIEKVIQPDGKEVWLDTNKVPYHDSEGNVVGIIGTYQNITKKRKSEQKLRESEEKYRNIIENTKEGYFETDLEGNFTFSNDAFCKMVGYTLEEIIGMSYKNIMNEESAKRTFKQFNEVYITGILEKSFEYEIIRKDGKALYGESSVYLRYDSKGNELGFAGFLRDVTEKREAEEKLKESEEKYRTIIENIKEGYFEVDLNGNFTYVNDALGQISGYSRGEGIGTSFSKYMTEESSKNTFKVFREVYDTGIPKENFQYEFFGKNGKKIYGESSIYLRYDADGNKIGFSGLLRDISEKMEAEQKLKESEEKFRTITEQALMGVIILQDNVIKYSNQQAANLIGYSIEEIKNWQPGEYIKTIYPEDREAVIRHAELRQKGLEDDINHYSFRAINRNGEMAWFEIYGKTIDYNGRQADLVTLLDITDVKKAEQKLKESEEKFRKITEQSILGICIMQGDVIKYSNQRLADIYGYQIEELLNLKPGEYLNMIAPEYRDFVMEQARKKQEGDKDILTQYIYKGIKNSGEEIWIENYSKTIEYEGRPANLITLSDITDKIKAEEKLKESEEKYRNMINDLDLGFYQLAWDDGSVLNVNPAFRKIMGYDNSVTLDEMNALDFWKNDEDRREYVNNLKKYNSVEDYIAIGKNIFGQDLVLQVHSHLIRDRNRTPIRIEGTVADITEKYNLEQKLKRSEERYRFLFENSPFAILLMDSNGVLRDSNPATEKLIGYKKEEFIGRTYSNLSIVDPEYLAILQNHIRLYFEGKQLPPIDVKFYKKDGGLIWANLISKTIQLGNETFLEVMGHDITERKNAELLIKEEVEKLKELDQIRKDLISRVSHELKTPLIPVLGGAEFLLHSYRHKFENDKEPLEILEMIEKGGNRLAKLVDNLLDVTRIEYEKFELEKQMTNLSEIVKETVKDMKYLIKKRDINLNLVIPDDLYLEIDSIRMEQVLTNLLSNAIKNTPPKGRVSLVLEKYGNWAILSVSDTGVGFTDEEMKKIFTRFGKIERYGEGLEYVDMEGSGLGLYITKQIVDLHNGKIWVESAGRNKGCIFKVRIPII